MKMNFKSIIKFLTMRISPGYSDYKYIENDLINLLRCANSYNLELIQLYHKYPEELKNNELFLNIKFKIHSLDQYLNEEIGILRNHYFMNYEKLKCHTNNQYEYNLKSQDIKYGLKILKEEIKRMEPRGKQIFYEIDPYGEELWED